jgi:hypothetical protein
MACRRTGVAMLASNSPPGGNGFGRRCAPVGYPRLDAVPAFFDGFRTSHEMQKIEIWNL